MKAWDELTPEQRAVMLIATEEAYLNGVIYRHNFDTRAPATGTALVAPPIPEATVRSLIPRFAEVVADMIERDWIEIREPHDGVWDNGARLTAEQIAAALADPDTWIWKEQDDSRMVMVMTTGRWDALAAR